MKVLSTYLFSALFVLAICSPLVIMQLSEEQTVSFTEKRKLAERPIFKPSLDSLNSFPKEYEAYFNDHFGLRNQMVRLYNAFFVSTFLTSPKAHTVVGSDRWLFLAVEFVIHDYMGLHLFDFNRLQHWKQVLLDRRQWLADQKIHYLFIPAPNKVMIYDDYLPDRIRKRQGTTNLQQFLDHLAAPPSFGPVLDLRPPLLAAKNDAQLYYKGDTHWNFDGAYVAYTAIMNRLSHWFADMAPVPKEEMVRDNKDFSGDLTYTLNLAKMYAEKSSLLYWPKGKELINFKRIKGYPQPDTPYQKFRRGKIYLNENPAKTVTALFISDSFGTALRDFLAPHFKKFIYVRDARFEDMKRLIEIEQPDVVIDLNVARGLYVALGENIEIRDYILKKNMIGREMLLDLTPENLQQGLSRTEELTFTDKKMPGRITVNGPDPQIYFRLPARLSTETLNVHCRINSSAHTYLKLYFQTEDHRYYSEKKKVYYKLRKGPNSIYLRIYEPIFLNKLRLDPGEVTGTYEIERITLTTEPRTVTGP